MSHVFIMFTESTRILYTFANNHLMRMKHSRLLVFHNQFVVEHYFQYFLFIKYDILSPLSIIHSYFLLIFH